MGGAVMYLSGSSVISGNKLTSNADSNLRLDSNTQTKLIISGTLETGADIHMMWSDDVASEIAWGVPTSDMSGYFTCDDPTYEAYYDADAKNIKWKLKATPKVDPTYTAPVGKTGLTYTGSTQELIGAGITNGGEMQYKLGVDGTYSTAIPTATKAGTYTVITRLWAMTAIMMWQSRALPWRLRGRHLQGIPFIRRSPRRARRWLMQI